MKIGSLVLGLAAIVASFDCSKAHATTIDFEGIPDGTPVSAGNPYGGVVNIQTRESFEYGISLSAGFH
jgi:hypothetical protein